MVNRIETAGLLQLEARHSTANRTMPLIVIATVAILSWGSLAFGGNYPWAYFPLMGTAAIVGVVGIVTSPNRRLPWTLIASIGTLAGVILIQLVPLPADLLERVSPATHNLLLRQVLPYASSGREATHSLSIHAASTWIALGFLVSYSLLMLGTARALTRAGLGSLAASIIGLGALLAVIGIVQMPFFDGRIYGFWEPMARNTSFGPFVNHNHFAGWMLMGLPIAVTFSIGKVTRGMVGVRPNVRDRLLWWSTPDASRAIIAVFAAALMGLALLLTSSRSGIISAGVAIVLIGAKLVRHGTAVTGYRWMAGVLATVAIGMTVWAGLPKIIDHFLHPSVATVGARLPIWRDTLAIIQDFPITGTGLNTYGYATLSYQTVAGEGHLREAHSDYLQLAAEGGLLLGMPILITLLVFVREIQRRFEAERGGSAYWLRFGACSGLIAIAVQSITDFSLQMPGNAAMFAVLAGIALREPENSIHSG